MGSVYLGERDDAQFTKQVAIKLLKRGMDTDAMLSRFRQERQILANLEHPFIARMLDGGATDSGLPYFVMEYVDGVPITAWCAEKQMTIPERLRLFQLVCEAVQYAHQNLVVHRDIKPTNILTTKEGIPKLLDFGIAKLVVRGTSDGATLTQSEARMLTPAYASPEQVRGLPISTASDIYSLGAVLYELLTGQRPHRFDSGSYVDMEKAICQVDPQKPSLVVGQSDETSPSMRKQLRRELSGDLDNIILTAMRKEPQRRYASAAELSEDIRRHMAGRPITAQEDRWTYRAGKFVRRNRLAVAAVLLIIVSLAGGMVTTTIAARSAQRRFEIVRGLAKTLLFDLHDEMKLLPGSTAPRSSAVRTVVKYLDALAQDGSPDPGLNLEMAIAYERVAGLEGHPYQSNLGDGPAALIHYRKALELFERLTTSPQFRVPAIRGVIDMHINVGQMESLLGNPSAASSHLARASAIANEAFARGDPVVPPSTQLNIYSRLADAEYQRGFADRELAYYRKMFEIAQQWSANGGDTVATSSLRDAYHLVGTAQTRTGDLFGARESFRRALVASEELARRADAKPEQRASMISLHNAFGDVLAAPDDPNFGDRSGALVHYEAALGIAKELAAADPRNVNARRNIAACYRRLGLIHVDHDPAQALTYYTMALKISQELSSGDSENAEYRYAVSRASMGVGEALHNMNRHDDAIRNLTHAIDVQKAIDAVSPERIWNLRVLSRSYTLLGAASLAAGEPDRALDSLREGLAVADRMLERAPASLFHTLDRADVLEAMGSYYLKRAGRRGIDGGERRQWQQEAKSCFQKSYSIWEGWTRRKVAAPYAARREMRAAAAIASIPTTKR